MAGYAWGGYLNGQIPLSALAQIPGTNQYIKKELLPAVVALRAAFKKRFGYDLEIVEAYRNLATQQYLYNGWIKKLPGFYLASSPGFSPHGWALAIDFGSNVNTYGTAEKAWMDANAPSYGFIATGNTFSPREAWHFDGTGTPTIDLASDGATPIDNTSPAKPPAPKGVPTMSYGVIYRVASGATGTQAAYRSDPQHLTFNGQCFFQDEPQGPLTWIEHAGVLEALTGAGFKVVERTAVELRDFEIQRYGHVPVVPRNGDKPTILYA